MSSGVVCAHVKEEDGEKIYRPAVGRRKQWWRQGQKSFVRTKIHINAGARPLGSTRGSNLMACQLVRRRRRRRRRDRRVFNRRVSGRHEYFNPLYPDQRRSHHHRRRRIPRPIPNGGRP